MNYNNYNTCCLITSIIVLFILLGKFKQINLCYILIISSLFSILWRSIKLINGEKIIEKNKNSQFKNPFYILDFSFATLAFICVYNESQINKKFIYLICLIFILSYIYYFYIDIYESNIIHTYGHVYIILIIILTFYLNIY